MYTFKNVWLARSGIQRRTSSTVKRNWKHSKTWKVPYFSYAKNRERETKNKIQAILVAKMIIYAKKLFFLYFDSLTERECSIKILDLWQMNPELRKYSFFRDT